MAIAIVTEKTLKSGISKSPHPTDRSHPEKTAALPHRDPRQLASATLLVSSHNTVNDTLAAQRSPLVNRAIEGMATPQAVI